MKIETISCNCGNVFAACVIGHIDASWKINREVYKLQGCIVSECSENVQFTSKDCCDQRKNLIHIDDLLEELRNEIEDEL